MAGGSLVIIGDPDDNELSFEENSLQFWRHLSSRDNRTGVVLGSTTSNNLLNCETRYVGTSSSTPNVHIQWIKNGEVVVEDSHHIIITETTVASINSSLEITNFTHSDVGVYQCILTYTDAEAEDEVITTTPFRLQTGIYYSIRVNLSERLANNNICTLHRCIHVEQKHHYSGENFS